LTSGVGGYVKVLPYMLGHYKSLGVDSMLINVHVADHDPPDLLSQVQEVTEKYGISPASVNYGPWYATEQQVYTKSRNGRPNDWFILADQDELHQYPIELHKLVEFCEREGYDYVSGCFLDRIAADGGLPPIDYSAALELQFPLGAFLTFPLHRGYPMKIVLAKGRVKIDTGQHIALTGRGCPIQEAFVQVHHYKWVAGLLPWLRQRMEVLAAGKSPWWVMAARTIRYYEEHNGRVDLEEPSFLVSDCSPQYKNWPKIVEMAIEDRDNKSLMRAAYSHIDLDHLRSLLQVRENLVKVEPIS
jgi:hypothetical protein